MLQYYCKVNKNHFNFRIKFMVRGMNLIENWKRDFENIFTSLGANLKERSVEKNH